MEHTWNGSDMLHYSGTGNLEQVRMLIESEGIDVNFADSDDHGSTALHEAAIRGRDEIAEYLLSKGANVDAKTVSDNHEISGATPLVYAVKAGHVSLAKILIDHGAKVDVIVNEYILLNIASEIDNPEMIDLLLNSGADINDSRGHGSITPLSTALVKGKYRNAQFLLDKGADYRKCCSDNLMPLIYAAQVSEGSEGIELLLKHIEKKEGKEKLLEHINCNDNMIGRTPLHVACMQKNYHAVKVLLKHGADYNIQDKEGLRPYSMVLANTARFPFLEDNSVSHVAKEIKWLLQSAQQRDYDARSHSTSR